MILKRGLVDVTSFSMATYLSFALFGAVTLPSMIMFTNDIRDSNTAGHITVVANAADSYLKDKRDIILASATATTPYVLDVATLKSAGYLRNGFSEKNNLTQGYHIRIYQPTNGTLHMMTFTTGGSDLTWDRAERVAQRIDNNSGKGGYISGTTAKGAQGAWSEALTAFGSYNPGDNHLVVANFYANMGATNDYLYRGTVAGHPEVNQMRTAIDMNANNINNAKDVTATGAVTTDEWFRTNGDTGWYSNKYGGGWHMTDDTWIRAYNGKSIMTDGQVKAGGRISTDEYLYTNKVEVAGSSCDKNGLIGRDASGGILSCQDRVWAKSVGSTRIVTSPFGNLPHPVYGYPDGGYAVCDSHEKIISGGGQCQDTSGQLIASMPSDNGWYTNCTDFGPGKNFNNDTPAAAFAICMSAK